MPLNKAYRKLRATKFVDCWKANFGIPDWVANDGQSHVITDQFQLSLIDLNLITGKETDDLTNFRHDSYYND